MRSCFRLQKLYGPFNTKDVYLSDFQFCFRFHELMLWSVAIGYSLSTHLRGSLHLEESSCSSYMKIFSKNHTAVK